MSQKNKRKGTFGSLSVPSESKELTQTTEYGITELLQSLEDSTLALKSSFDSGDLSPRSFLVLQCSLRSLFSEVRRELEEQGLSGAEVTALRSWATTLFTTSFSTSRKQGGRCSIVFEEHDIHSARRKSGKILQSEEN